MCVLKTPDILFTRKISDLLREINPAFQPSSLMKNTHMKR
jgi:hypothetical protein